MTRSQILFEAQHKNGACHGWRQWRRYNNSIWLAYLAHKPDIYRLHLINLDWHVFPHHPKNHVLHYIIIYLGHLFLLLQRHLCDDCVLLLPQSFLPLLPAAKTINNNDPPKHLSSCYMGQECSNFSPKNQLSGRAQLSSRISLADPI